MDILYNFRNLEPHYDEEGCRIYYQSEVDSLINEIYSLHKEALKEQSKGNWILVSERLPKIAERCIVQLSNGYITIGEYFSIGKWTLIETAHLFVYPKETVVAWQPLPKD